MGKTSKSTNTTTTSSLPISSQSVLSVNGNPLVETSIKDNTLYSNYNYTPEEQAINKYVQDSLLTSLPNVNTFLPETIANMDSQIEAYTKKGIDSINDIYTPMIQSLQNNVASRFGNLDNSIFMENLNGLESKRASAVSSLAEDVQSKRSELINNELQNQYNYLNFLTGYQNQNLQNVLNATKLNQSNLSLNNDYQNSLYNYLNNKSSQAYSALGNVNWGQLANNISKLGYFL